MNNLILTGRLTKDVEIKTIAATGNSFAVATLAYDVGFGDRKRTDYAPLIFPTETADRMIKAKVKKGSPLQIVGELNLKQQVTVVDGKNVYKYVPSINVKSWEYFGYASRSDGEQHQTLPTQTAPQTVVAPTQPMPQQVTQAQVMPASMESYADFTLISDDGDLPF